MIHVMSQIKRTRKKIKKMLPFKLAVSSNQVEITVEKVRNQYKCHTYCMHTRYMITICKVHTLLRNCRFSFLMTK